jgi:hypothetical protein
LAAHVYGVDPALGRKIAETAGTTLEALGLVAPRPRPSPERLVDSVVCAAADVLGLAPRDTRPALLAAFSRVRELDLDVATVESALAGAKPQR